MKKIFISVIIIGIKVSILYGDQVTIHNKSDTDLWAAVYYYQHDPLNRVTEPFLVKAQSNIKVERPSYKLLTDRYLLVSLLPSFLPHQETVQNMKKMLNIDIGLTRGTHFYLNVVQGTLKGYNELEWTIAPAYEKVAGTLNSLKESATNFFTSSMIETLKKSLPAIQNNPYKDKVANVRTSNALNEQERAYILKRKPIVKKTLEKFLGRSLDGKYIPTIARIDTGGGCRMMIASMGATVGFEEIGMLDAVTYMVGLSGSTWFLAAWITSGLPIHQFKEQITPIFSRSLYQINAQESKLLAESILSLAVFNQPLTTIDVYNALLMNMFFALQGDKRQQVYLSDQQRTIKNGTMPFPIYTAVRAEEFSSSQECWYEFTPFEVGAPWLGMYVPTWAFGRKFENGKSVDFAPEQPMPLGLWGSAYGGNIENIYTRIEGNLSEMLKSPLKKVMVDIFGQRRFSWAEVFNFSYGVQSSVLKSFPALRMVDAAALPGFGLPYPPVSGERPERSPDIYILIDYSDDMINASTLKDVEKYAKQKSLKFPPIMYQGIGNSAVQVFKDENNPNVPIIIRVSRLSDTKMLNELKNNPSFAKYKKYVEGFDVAECASKKYCGTLNFTYQPDQVRQLSGFAEFQIAASKDIFVDAINWVIDKKSQ